MIFSERNGISNLIIKSAINFLAKIIMWMISNCLSRKLLYTVRAMQINRARRIPNCRGVALSTPPHSAEVKEQVEVYLYTPSGPSWQVVGLTLRYVYFDSDQCPGDQVCAINTCTPVTARCNKPYRYRKYCCRARLHRSGVNMVQ
jgi:hypothetical protein